jgi:hypothetical protein
MALTTDRNTRSREGDQFTYPVAAGARIFAGAITMLNTSGYAVPGGSGAEQICIGRAEEQVDNSAGADGDLTITVRSGVFKYANNILGRRAIGPENIGTFCYAETDDMVAKLDIGGTLSVAGRVVGVDTDGVWVRMGL